MENQENGFDAKANAVPGTHAMAGDLQLVDLIQPR